jgi:tripartite-type tricarboxylate transporter receptor subunit TctC
MSAGNGLVAQNKREEMMQILKWTRALAVAGVAGLAAPAVHAQGVADFYKGKTVEVIVGSSVGGGYDIYGRLVARHLGKHIPGNPTVVAKNMEGAGGLRLANWLYNVAPKDGTVLGTYGRGIPFDPILGGKNAQFEATKYNWIGSANDEVSICAAWKGAGITKFDELFSKEMIVGGTGSTADSDLFPKVINGVFGTKMRVISGYPGGNDITLAMERGEVRGRCGWSWSSIKTSHQKWVEDKTLNLLVQLSLEKHPDLPNVPLIMDFAKTEEQKQILRLVFARQVMGRPFGAPPGVPADRVAALRKAFMDTMKDPEFMAEANKSEVEITPVSGEDIQKLVKDVYDTPAEVAQKAAALLK